MYNDLFRILMGGGEFKGLIQICPHQVSNLFYDSIMFYDVLYGSRMFQKVLECSNVILCKWDLAEVVQLNLSQKTSQNRGLTQEIHISKGPVPLEL